MLILGAKGLAKEVLEIFHERNELKNLYFYDDVSNDLPDCLYGQFRVLKNMEEVAQIFKTDNRFIIGLGNPLLRLEFYNRFSGIAGKMVSAISPAAHIGHYGTEIGEGCIIMANTVITNDVKIGCGCLINPGCIISHDVVIEDFTEISPGVKITGRCRIGQLCSIGTGAVILPNIKIGKQVTVGAGAVVTKDVQDGLIVKGVPAKVIEKKNE